MEQVYYTQCPMGHGLGATGGFQLKRISRGYPRTADFRHLGMRVQLSGLTVVSPRALRYRLDGGAAEIAWLAPRAREFEVAAGDGSTTRQYGRPGGLFAHGLRLTLDELEAIENWPAGLFDWDGWVECDGRPTAGQFLDPLAPTAGLLAGRRFRPSFADLAREIGQWGEDFLAGLLASAASAVTTGRTLFLIDAPSPPGRSQLGGLLAALTFAFPPPLRRELTFSTYHERPEGLPGFRIHGTTPAARPERAAMRALGAVADLESRAIEPTFDPPRWARRLASWIASADEDSWKATCVDLFARARLHASTGVIWRDSWLDQLFLFHDRNRKPGAAMADAETRRELRETAEWAQSVGLSGDWAARHGPGWWGEAARVAGTSGTGCALLIQQARMRETWEPSGDPPAPAADWAGVVSAWFGSRSAEDWEMALRAFFSSAPAVQRTRLAASLVRSCPGRAKATLDWLERGGALDRTRLLLLKAIHQAGPTADPAGLADVLAQALEHAPSALPILEAVVREVVDRPGGAAALGDALAAALVRVRSSLERAAWADLRGRILAWALGRPFGPDVLSAHLRETLSDQPGRDAFLSAAGLVPESARLLLLHAALAATAGRPDHREAFRWVAERMLMPTWGSGTVPDTRWADPYLASFDSDKPAYQVMFSTRRIPRLADWLGLAEGVGEFSEAASARLARCVAFRAALAGGPGPAAPPLLEVPPEERPWLLRELLLNLGWNSIESLLGCLGSCQASWTAGAFLDATKSRDRLAAPIAEALAWLAPAPGGAPGLDFPRWMASLGRVLDRLGAGESATERFRPDGPAAAIVAATSRLDSVAADRWSFRREILMYAGAYRALAADVRADLRHGSPESARAAFAEWDQHLEVGTRGAAFHEVFLNGCDDAQFLALAPARAESLRTLPPLPWWRFDQHDGAPNDLRERYARAAPMAPLRHDELMRAVLWFEPDEPHFLPDPDLPAVWPSRDGVRCAYLSPLGRARWTCLQVISEIGARDWVQWASVLPEVRDLPLSGLTADDRYRLVAWLIAKASSEDVETFDFSTLTDWLGRAGADDPARLERWAEDLPEGAGWRERVRPRAAFVEALVRAISGGTVGSGSSSPGGPAGTMP